MQNWWENYVVDEWRWIGGVDVDKAVTDVQDDRRVGGLKRQ